MSRRGEVLVAIMNNLHDFAIARDDHWYRVPLDNVAKRLKVHWPPQWLAFYQTKDFGEEAFAVHYYAQVLAIRERGRRELFPDEPPNPKSHRRYYQVMLNPLQRLARPIVSRRFRRVIFIPTTMAKLLTAGELNDLWDESPLEDALWEEMKRREIIAERQEYVEVSWMRQLTRRILTYPISTPRWFLQGGWLHVIILLLRSRITVSRRGIVVTARPSQLRRE